MNKTSEIAAACPPDFPNRCVMMWKMDGLCQRIVATIHGLVIASEFDLQFKLAWVDDKSMKFRFDQDYSLPNDTPEDPLSIFSKSFIDEYYVEDSDIHYPAELVPRKRSNGLNVPGRDKIIMNTGNDFERAARQDTFFGLAPYKLNDEFLVDYLDKGRSIARSGIFSDEIECLLDDIDANMALRNMWSLHLRSGDVVYGDIRKRYPRRRELSMTVPVAIDICRFAENTGKRVLVVGASNQDIDLVLSCCPNAVSATDIDLPPVTGFSAVFRDAILMSRCEKLFSAKDSAVVRLANFFGNPVWTTADDFYSTSSESDVLKSALDDREQMSCHNLQKAFVYYNLFILNWNREDFQSLDSYLNAAFELDPENISYVALRYLNCLSFSKFRRADSFREQFTKSGNNGEAGRGRGARRMVNHIGFRSKFMQEFLIDIYQNKNLPKRHYRMIESWVDRFYSKIL